MILVIDSGATSSNWKFISEDESCEVFKAEGFNLSTSHIGSFRTTQPHHLKASVKSIFYFGAGTGNPDREEALKQKLVDRFPDAENIYIGSDLLSAGIATSYANSSIVSILGTGSNCCHFNGLEIHKSIHNLGYILGDEGSGFAMGKMILQDYFYQRMEEGEKTLFELKFGISRNDLIRKVYHEDNRVNMLIAEYSRFLSISSPAYRYKIGYSTLEQFFEKQLLQFSEQKMLLHHFSGSISFHFQDIIKELALKYGLKIGKIIQNPIDSLTYSILKQINTN